jgi:hypothetical protein
MRIFGHALVKQNETIRDIAVKIWKASHDPAPAAIEGQPKPYSFHGVLGKDPVVLVRQTGAFLENSDTIPPTPYPTTYEIMGLEVVTRPNGQIRHNLVSLESIEARHSDWVDFARRVRALNDMKGGNPNGTRCGDIIIIPDTKAGFNAVHEGDAYPGWHGGPSQADSYVPLTVASEALSVEGANEVLRKIIDFSKQGSVQQNSDTTRVIQKIFTEVK